MDAGAFLEFVESLPRIEANTLAELLSAMPGDLCEREKVAVLCHTRMYHLLTERPLGAVSSEVENLVRFLWDSWDFRTQVAYSRLDKLLAKAGNMLRPVKFARILKASHTKPRYFRDLDLLVAVRNGDALGTLLKVENIIPGDLDPEDWNRYHVTSTPITSEELSKVPEFHGFYVERVTAGNLERRFDKVEGVWGRLSEFQFYTRFGGSFCVRTFLDFTVEENTPYRRLIASLAHQYVDDLLLDMKKDLDDGGICPLQAFEVRDLLSDTAGLPGETRDLACRLGYLPERPSGIPHAIAPAVLKFVRDRLRRVRAGYGPKM